MKSSSDKYGRDWDDWPSSSCCVLLAGHQLNNIWKILTADLVDKDKSRPRTQNRCSLHCHEAGFYLVIGNRSTAMEAKAMKQMSIKNVFKYLRKQKVDSSNICRHCTSLQPWINEAI